MDHRMNIDIANLPRESDFAFRLDGIYTCRNLIISESSRIWDGFEVCIRLRAANEYCDDLMNGELLHLAFPHVALKRPGTRVVMYSSQPRDVISFWYSPEVFAIFADQRLLPPESAWEFELNSDFRCLIAEFRQLSGHLYTPGAAERMDWTCFKLYRELLAARRQRAVPISDSARIRNIAAYLTLNYNTLPNLDEVARRYGMSHATFFRKWQKFFPMTPIQYVLDLKLEEAARQLRLTALSINEIVKAVHFSGPSVFYRRFREKFGVSPEAYRSGNMGAAGQSDKV